MRRSIFEKPESGPILIPMDDAAPATTLETARAAKSHAMEVFEKIAPVSGVGITRVDGDYALKVNLRHSPAQGTVVPATVDGVKVRVEVVGPIEKR